MEAECKKSKAEQAANPGLGDAYSDGLQDSVIALAVFGKESDKLTPEQRVALPWLHRMARSMGTITGDLPLYGTGATIGAPGGPLTASAGAFGFAGGLRSVYLDQIRNGKVKDFDEFMQRSFAIMGDTTKGMVKGGATTLGGQAGGLAARGLGVSGKAAGAFAGETAALTSVSAAMEGRYPTAQEFSDNAALILTLKTAGKSVDLSVDALRGKLITITDKTGTLPEEVARDVKANPEYAKSVLEDPNATTYIFAKTVESAAKRMNAKDPLTYLRETQVSVVEVEPRYEGKGLREIRTKEEKNLLKNTLSGESMNEQTGEMGYLPKGGVDHAISSATRSGEGRLSGYEQQHMEAVANFDKLWAKAILGEVHPNYKDGRASTAYRYYSLMKVDNEAFVVKITAIQETGKSVGRAEIESVDRLYDLYLTKKVPENSNTAPQTSTISSGTARLASGTANTIPTTSGNVNTVSLFNILEGLKESAFPKKQPLIEKKK